MTMTNTSTNTSTKTKVLAGLLFAGIAIAAGYGIVWKIKAQGVPVLSGDTSTGDVQVGPTIPTFQGDGDSLGNSQNFNTNNSNSNSNSNSNNANSSNNYGAGNGFGPI